jgi:hypothetical protein
VIGFQMSNDKTICIKRERGNAKRTIVSMKGEFLSNGKTYTGHVGNVSKNGMFMSVFNPRTVVDFIPGTKSEVKIYLSSGKTIRLRCEIKWLHTYKTSSQGLVNSLGMALKDIPREYKEFIETVQNPDL